MYKMIININNESIIVLFFGFFLFSYTMKYVSIFLNVVYKKNLNIQNELYESGAPIYYKQDTSLNLQSYLLAIFFLLFELELFLTYPILFALFKNPIMLSEHIYNFIATVEIDLQQNSENINSQFNFLLNELIDSFLSCFSVFFLNLIAALALEWSFGGLTFSSNKFGKFNSQ